MQLNPVLCVKVLKATFPEDKIIAFVGLAYFLLCLS